MGNAKLPLGKGKAGKNPELLRQEILLAPRLKRMTGNNNANMVKTSLDQQTGQKPSSQESCIQSAQLNAEEQPASQDERPSQNSILPSVESQQQPRQVSSLPQADELHQTIAMLQQMKQAIMQQMQLPPQELSTSLPDDTESISQPPPRTLIDSLLETSPEFFSQKLVSLSKHEHEFLAVLESNPALMAVLEGRKFPFSPRVKKKGRVRSARLYQAKHCRSLHQNLNEMDMHSGMMLGLEAGMLIGLQAKQFSNASMMMTEVLNDSSLVDEDGVSNLVSDMQQVVVPRMQSQLLEQQQGTSSTLCRQLTLQQKHASLFAHEKSEQPSAADSQRLSSPSTNILNGSSDVASQESCFGHESRTSKKRMRKRLWRAKLRKAKLSGAPPLPKF